MKPAQPVPKALCQQRFPGCWSCWNYLVGVWKISNVSCPDPLENLCLSGTGGLERRKWVADVAQLCGACVNGTGPGYNQHQKASKWNMVLVLFSESRTLSQSVNKNTTDVKVWTTKCLRNEGNFMVNLKVQFFSILPFYFKSLKCVSSIRNYNTLRKTRIFFELHSEIQFQ
jgi:hypothetical protein